jgi:acyl-CoA synthetase (AMP-forming)/AMP-acid ligase II
MNEQERWETILSLGHPQAMSLGAEIEKLARDQADKPAIIYNDRRLSYAELNSLANRYASFFYTQGFKKGDVVALYMENRPEYLAAITGLSKLGVIVALLDIGIRGQVLAREVNLCEARAVIVSHELLGTFESVITRLRLKSPAVIFVNNAPDDIKLNGNMQALDPLLQLSSPENPATTQSITSEDYLAYAFTAGQSGLRKGVAIRQQRWLKNGHLFSLFGHMNEATVQYMCLPLHFNIGCARCDPK